MAERSDATGSRSHAEVLDPEGVAAEWSVKRVAALRPLLGSADVFALRFLVVSLRSTTGQSLRPLSGSLG